MLNIDGDSAYEFSYEYYYFDIGRTQNASTNFDGTFKFQIDIDTFSAKELKIRDAQNGIMGTVPGFFFFWVLRLNTTTTRSSSSTTSTTSSCFLLVTAVVADNKNNFLVNLEFVELESDKAL